MANHLLVTTVKNEGPNILEWVAYHRAIGFDRIQVYQNDSDDLTHRILRVLNRIGAIEYYRNDCRKRQWQNKAYRRASSSEAYRQADWCMALDGDEFLNVKAGDGMVSDLTDACDHPDEILVNWRNFGCSGHVDLDDGLVTDRFIEAERKDLIVETRPAGFKTLFKRAAYRRPGIHRPRVRQIENIRSVNGSNLPTKDLGKVTWRSFDPKTRALAQVNHYCVRDVSSFLLKTVRGSSSHVNRRVGLKYWQVNNHSEGIDHSIQRHSERLRAEMERLNAQSNGRLAQLREKSLRIWRAKLDELLKDPSVQETRETLIKSIKTPASA
jgi:hypothetical protein